MNAEDGADLILKAFDKRNEERSFELYKSKYQWMDENNFVPFEKFHSPSKEVRGRHSQTPESPQTEAEILADVEAILNMDFKGGGSQ